MASNKRIGGSRIAYGGKALDGARIGILMSERLRLPVFSIYSFVTRFHAGLVPRDFSPPGSAPRRSPGAGGER